MLGGGASVAIASIWTSMANWSTPTVLFCVLNLIIGTIFIASNFKSPNHHHHHNIPSQLAPSPSLLERVRSVNLSSFYTTSESHDQHKVYSETTEHNSVSQLRRPPSLLQRVKSIDLSFSAFQNSLPTESEQSNSMSEVTRAPSLLDRVKSFKLTSPFNSDHHSGDTPSQVGHSDMDLHHDSVDDRNLTSANKLSNLSEKSDKTLMKRSSSNLTKSRSEKRVAGSDGGEEGGVRRQPEKRVGVHDESVDAKADDFIKRFKQQLKLQRLDSLQRLREMLNGGTSST